MTDTEVLRANALRKLDSAERWFKGAIISALACEALFLAGILYYANWRDPLHLLLLCCTGIIYLPLLLGLIALGAHMNRCTLRVLTRLDDAG
jgi:hypothetical protein